MFSNLRLGARLALGFGIVLTLLCVMAGLSAWQITRLADAAAFYDVNLVPSFDVETKVGVAMGDLRRFGYQHILSDTDAQMDALDAKIDERLAFIRQNIDRYERELIADEEDRADLKQVRDAIAAYQVEWEKIRPISRKTASDPSMNKVAETMMIGPAGEAYGRATEAVAKWFAYNMKLSADQAKASEHTRATALTLIAAIAVAALLAGATGAWLITRSITQPIRRAVDVASKVAAGDLGTDIRAEGSDETADLLRALGRMNTSLRDIVGQVRSSSDSIATGSSQIAAGNADLSQRTEEQASNLQQTAASMEQLSGSVRTSAETAAEASRMAVEAASAATRGGDLVGQVVETMQGIAASSRQISDIITVIDGIAFQTNILALNAAVEAARAGEQGRGFAVVASEVRSLASRSSEAAREIKSLIGASAERVEAGTRRVDEAGQAMEEIVSQVRRVSQMIDEISGTSQEQSAGIGQVGDAMNQLDQVTQQNAALVEESAASAESLKHQADRLAEAVRAFRLSETAMEVRNADVPPREHAVTPARPRPPAPRAVAVPSRAPLASPAVDGEWDTF